MGIVPENQYLPGLEGAGVMRRIGPKAHMCKEGQRVIISRRGCFANRVLCPRDSVYPLPDSMSFEVKDVPSSIHQLCTNVTILQKAATIASMYLVSVYGLFDMGGMRSGHVRGCPPT